MRIVLVLRQIGTSASDANTHDAKRAAQPRHRAAVPLELNVGSVAAGPAVNCCSRPFLGTPNYWVCEYRLSTEYPSTV
jgi:hypothetical protein